jgi:peptidoglycan/xylan/chitin deacetylase (PgdA/CDA1 family)
MLDLLLTAARRLIALVHGLALRASARRAGLALVYHRVGGATGDPAKELVPPHGTALFDAHMHHLRARYRVVKASELRGAVASRRRGQRFPVAVTFDDDLWSHVGVAMPVLRRYEVPATFFLGGASLDVPHQFWWELLDRTVDVRELDAGWVKRTMQNRGSPPATGEVALIHRLGHAIETMPPQQRDRTVEELRSLAPDGPKLPLGVEEVETLARAGFEIGFHTRRHHQLLTLNDDELATALHDGRSELERVVGVGLRTLAYPHGRADPRIAAAARDAGYLQAFTTVAQAVVPDDDPWLLGRYEPSFRSHGHFVRELVELLASARSSPRD